MSLLEQLQSFFGGSQTTPSPFAKLYTTLADTPVSSHREKIAKQAASGRPVVVSANTGSGKTLSLPPSLADATGEQVVVLVPRRQLASSLAEDIAALSDLELGRDVGYAMGGVGGDSVCVDWKAAKIVVMTYGYALQSQKVMNAKHIVLDEVHEATLDISLARALIRERLAAGEDLSVIEMSATGNTPKQLAYWQGSGKNKPQAIEVKGEIHRLDRRHVPQHTGQPDEAAIVLMKELSRTHGQQKDPFGAVVFRPGKREVLETAAALREKLSKHGMGDVEVSTITGDMNYKQRQEAVAAPKNSKRKIVISTNVLESGANIKWLRGGVSDGLTKMEESFSNGSSGLITTEMTQDRLEQQGGRVRRFAPGIFMLAANTDFSERPAQVEPEIKRLGLDSLVFSARRYGYNPAELTFDEKVDRKDLARAHQNLVKLQLLSKDGQLTKIGAWVSKQPVDLNVGRMMWEAKERGVLNEFLPVAAALTAGNLKETSTKGHGMDKTADALDKGKAFNAALHSFRDADRSRALEDVIRKPYNMNISRFFQAREAYDKLKEKHKIRREQEPTLHKTGKNSAQLDKQLRLCVLAGQVNDLFVMTRKGATRLNQGTDVYDLDTGSVQSRTNNGTLLAGSLRTIHQYRRNKTRTMVENIMPFTLDELREVRPDLIQQQREVHRSGQQAQVVAVHSIGGQEVSRDVVPQKSSSPQAHAPTPPRRHQEAPQRQPARESGRRGR